MWLNRKEAFKKKKSPLDLCELKKNKTILPEHIMLHRLRIEKKKNLLGPSIEGTIFSNESMYFYFWNFRECQRISRFVTRRGNSDMLPSKVTYLNSPSCYISGTPLRMNGQYLFFTGIPHEMKYFLVCFIFFFLGKSSGKKVSVT